MHDEKKTVKIFTLEREHQSLLPLIEKTFEAENIPLQIRSNFDTAYDGIFVTQKGLGGIYVFEQDQTQAEQLLNDILSGKIENDDN